MKSFRYAWCGLVRAVKTERNLRIHLAAMYYVFFAGRLFEIEAWAWTAIFVSCGLVIGAEMLNTALEELCDTVEPGHSPKIGAVKDLVAGAVLVCAIAAAGVAAAIFMGRELPEYLFTRPAVWANIAALPVWALFVFFGGSKHVEKP